MSSIEELPRVIAFEHVIREADQIIPATPTDISPYWSSILDTLAFYKYKKNSNKPGMGRIQSRLIDSCFMPFLADPVASIS